MPAAESSAQRPAPGAERLIYTFYSYKGGVGRSMALANVACLLAKWGRRVLAVDFDLEAPGLDRYFQPNPGGEPDAKRIRLKGSREETPGILDLIESRAAGQELHWSRCLIEARLPEKLAPKAPPISLMSAGRATPSYAERVQQLRWDELFHERRLGSWLNELREEWLETFDVVLIDSRTGISDIGGICTIILPDVLVLFFTANQQSIEGAADVLRRARAAQDDLPVERGRLVGLPVLARDESQTEYQQSLEWRRRVAEDMREYYADWISQRRTPRDVINKLHIPYHAYWSFGERLPVIEAPDEIDDPRSISSAFGRLSLLIANEVDFESLATQADATQLEEAQTELSQVRHEAEQASRARRRAWAAMAALVVLSVSVVAFSLYSGFRTRVSQAELSGALLTLATTADDPVVGALLARELEGMPEPSRGAERLRELLGGTLLPLAILPTPQGVRRAHFSPDGKRVLVTGEDGSSYLWRADGRGSPRRLGSAGVFSPDGASVLSSSGAGDALLCPTEDELPCSPLARRFPGVTQLGFSPDGRLAFALAEDSVRIMGGADVTLPAEGARLLEARFSSDGALLATVGESFNRGGPRFIARIRESAHTRAVYSSTSLPAISRGGDRLLISDPPLVKLVDVREGVTARIDLPGPVLHLALDRDGRQALIVVAPPRDDMGELLYWRPYRDELKSLGSIPVEATDRLSFSPDGLLYGWHTGREVLVGDLVSGAVVHRAGVVPVHPTALALGSERRALIVLESIGFAVPRETGVVLHLGGAAAGAALSDAGRRALTWTEPVRGTAGQGVRVWSLDRGEVELDELDWDQLIDYAATSTSACLDPQSRAELLNEELGAALVAWEQCEREQGRGADSAQAPLLQQRR